MPLFACDANPRFLTLRKVGCWIIASAFAHHIHALFSEFPSSGFAFFALLIFSGVNAFAIFTPKVKTVRRSGVPAKLTEAQGSIATAALFLFHRVPS